MLYSLFFIFLKSNTKIGVTGVTILKKLVKSRGLEVTYSKYDDVTWCNWCNLMTRTGGKTD